MDIHAMNWMRTLVARLLPNFPMTAVTRNVLIVKRGLSPEYYAFCEILATANAAEVLLDRRSEERRWQPPYTGQDRRHADRRKLEPLAWTNSNFVLTRISLAENQSAACPDTASP